MIDSTGKMAFIGISQLTSAKLGMNLLILLCLFMLFIGAHSQTLHPAEVNALRSIKKTLTDPYRNLRNWNRRDPCTSNWTGVICYDTTLDDGHLHVRALSLLNMNLSGSLSPELGRLSYMRILDFMWNNISGTIPKEIGNITTLELLLLNGNQLTGSLPDELGSLSNLDRIQIDENQISGPIPLSFANLSKAKHFHMNNNSLSGQIPPELSRLPILVHLLLDNNNLSGYLPPELSLMPSLMIIQLDNNDFDGSTIPSSYGNMSQLLKLSLRNCSLRGAIPDWSNIPSVAYIDFSLNRLSGSIPTGALSENITTIDLSNNNLTGTIPASFSRLPHLQKLSLSNNSLIGSIPSIIWQSRTLNASERLFLDFENNMFSNISGSFLIPPNITIGLQGNPACSNSTLIQFCGPHEEDLSNTLNITNVNDCPPHSCPPHYEYAPSSPSIRCFCAAPLYVGYRFKSPGFSDFLPYVNAFKKYLSSGLSLNLDELDIDSVAWQNGHRLRMYLKIFPTYVNESKEKVKGIATRWCRYIVVSRISMKIDGVRSFAYGELALATNNFNSSSLVGEGGYGKVYKGILADGTAVAIKRAQEGSMQGEMEFLTEIELLSRVHHRNLVSLIGYCDEEAEQMLVYEFMSNGTLRDQLSGKYKVPLNFGMRVRTALDAARGILYLHTEANPPIFHRDIKASNILLDSKCTAKVADFGLSRLAPLPDLEGYVPAHVSTVVKGTPGYLDPEYFLTQKLTDKSDVYSLGVVFLELLTGMHPISRGKNIVREVNIAYRSGMIFSIIDDQMGSYPSECVERFMNLALKCCQDETDVRPSMSEVVRELESIWLMMPDSDTKITESFVAHPGKVATPPSWSSSSSFSSTLKPYYVSQDVSGSDLASGAIPTVKPR
ncbi:hypothetical protein BUALT_Bualt02G0162400 [Buddleja alternifolia]|uniref:non-specific serine/threonine protein kinase n=1 Tax=Buddleja alternifolia TaxID=168488 RepID=A0AAV6Y0Q7_9LAMI|nr:hypothetical protein BUALT_Bualt02G0162400 [Buddleja alternifolia]